MRLPWLWVLPLWWGSTCQCKDFWILWTDSNSIKLYEAVFLYNHFGEKLQPMMYVIAVGQWFSFIRKAAFLCALFGQMLLNSHRNQHWVFGGRFPSPAFFLSHPSRISSISNTDFSEMFFIHWISHILHTKLEKLNTIQQEVEVAEVQLEML